MSRSEPSSTRMSEEIQRFGLERYVLELEVDGLTVVPPDVHGVPEEAFDAMTDRLLGWSEDLVGCPFSVEGGPSEPVSFTDDTNVLAELSGDQGMPSQFLIQQLGRRDRLFRDLAVNPVAIALIRHLIGSKATRFSSHNSFVKWQGEFGYGRNLGGSHRRGTRPVFPEATEMAVPVEASKGSMIVFHGATWHGAFPRLVPGMRLSVANYYRHYMVLPQEDFKVSFPETLAGDCTDPETFRVLAGFDDVFPYTDQRERIPQAIVADR